MDLFHTNRQFFSLQDVNWWTGVVWISYCAFYQLFGLSFWRHPFTAEVPLVSKWCNAKFPKICSLMAKWKYLVFQSRSKFLSRNIVLTYLSTYYQYLLYWIDLNVKALFCSVMIFGHTQERLQKKKNKGWFKVLLPSHTFKLDWLKLSQGTEMFLETHSLFINEKAWIEQSLTCYHI